MLRRAQDDVLNSLEDFHDYLELAEGSTDFYEEFASWYLENLEPYLREGSDHNQLERRLLSSPPSPRIYPPASPGSSCGGFENG